MIRPFKPIAQEKEIRIMYYRSSKRIFSNQVWHDIESKKILLNQTTLTPQDRVSITNDEGLTYTDLYRLFKTEHTKDMNIFRTDDPHTFLNHHYYKGMPPYISRDSTLQEVSRIEYKNTT